MWLYRPHPSKGGRDRGDGGLAPPGHILTHGELGHLVLSETRFAHALFIILSFNRFSLVAKFQQISQPAKQKELEGK